MIAVICFCLTLLALPFKSKSRLEAENAALRQQVSVLQRRVSGRVQFTNGDRLFLVLLYRWCPSVWLPRTQIRAYRWCSPPRRRLRNNGSEPLDRACAVCILAKR